jgi:hypothetical protein
MLRESAYPTTLRLQASKIDVKQQKPETIRTQVESATRTTFGRVEITLR